MPSLFLDIPRIRKDFPILSRNIHGKNPLIYFDNAASTQHPMVVLEAMDRCYRETYANVHRGIHWLSEQATDQFEQARSTVARFLGTSDPAQVIFTSGTTASINLIARSWSEVELRPGDEILLTVLEHHSNIVPWMQAAQRAQAQVVFADITDDGQFNLDDWRRKISPRTRLASFAGISNVLGYSLPIREMIAAAQERNVLTFLDAAQTAPHATLDVESLGVDFAAFSGHKLLGPTGIGVLYGKRHLLEHLPPFLGGGSMIREVTTQGFSSGELPAKFEAGTPPIVEAIGLAAAIDYLMQLNLDNIRSHVESLAQHARQNLSKIPRIRFLVNTRDAGSGIVSFHFPDLAAQDVAVLLDRKGIALRAGHHCTMPLHDRLKIPASLRASFYCYNSLEEVDTFTTCLETVVSKLRD